MSTRLIPVPKWNEYHAWPPTGGLRHLIFQRHKNGFDAVLVRPSRVWLIDEKKFFEWLNSREYIHPLNKKMEKNL